MIRRACLVLGCLVLCACDEADFYRAFGVSQGTLVADLGMPMAEVQRRSSLKLHESRLGRASWDYTGGNAYFDFELAGSPVRFKGCSMYSIDAAGPDKTVTHIGVFVTSGRLRWRAFGDELRGTAGMLRAAGFEPYLHDGWQPLEAFLARDPGSLEQTPSDVVATFDWKRAGKLFRLSAHQGWDSERFWSSFDLNPGAFWEPSGERWLGEFRAYPGAREVCSQHALGAPGSQPREIAWTQYTTPDEPRVVAAFYTWEGGELSSLGDSGLEVGSKDARKRLSVHPVSGSYSDCGKKLPPDARTVLVLSQALP